MLDVRAPGPAAAYADIYSREDAPVGVFFRRRQELVMEALRRVPRGTILDVGCGPGMYASACSERGFAYRGLDLSEEMIDEACYRHGHLPDVSFVCGDARHLPYPSRSFDALLCLGILEYTAPQEQGECLNEITRVVRPGGLVVFSLLNAESPHWVWLGHVYPRISFVRRNALAILGMSQRVTLGECLLEGTPTRKFRLGRTLGVLRRQGFSVLERRFFCFNPCPPPLARFARFASQATERLERLSSVPLIERLGLAFVIVARTPRAAAADRN
jgi:SAM-dependent methyltransferase